MSDVEQLCTRLRLLRTNDNTIDWIRKHLEEDARDETPWLHIAAQLRRDGQFDAALEMYETAARRFPDSARLWNNRGVLLREYGHLDKSIASFERALALRPDYVLAIESIAIAYEKLQRFDVASQFYRKALSLDEQRPLCWNNLGNCLRMQGLPIEAKESYDQAIACEPNYPDAIFNLATLQYEQANYAAASSTLDRYDSLVPADPSSEGLREKICANASRPERIGPAPLHGSGLTVMLGTNIDERGNVIEPNLGEGPMLLTGQDILRMSREEAAREVGTQTWDRLHLQQLIKAEVSRKPRPPDGPALPFISYRWGNIVHSEWVMRFVRDLEERGYDVTLDKSAEIEDRPPTAPEFIARMCQCNLFVPVLTNEYTRRVLVSPHSLSPVEYGWVYEEWQVALELARIGRLGFAGIWIAGDDLPPPFTRSSVHDFRSPERYGEEMDKMFPIRYLTVIGIRRDNTFRALTRIRRSEAKAAIARLQALDEFAWIATTEG